MSALPQEPDITIMNLVKTNWNNASTKFLNAPRFSTGWGDEGDWNIPQVLFIGPDETPDSTGNTGFSAMQSTGLPMKRMIGNMSIVCLAHSGMKDMGTDAKSLAYEMSEEVKRIINVNYLLQANGLDWISFFSRNKVEDTTRKPVVHRRDCTITYGYDDRV